MSFSRCTACALAWLIASAGAARSDPDPASEFVFARLAFGNVQAGDWARWRADWPDAEWHFTAGLARLTAVDVARESQVFEAGDTGLFDHPWLYAVEVGSMGLSASEADSLREYLLRGGFLMVDDFHGLSEWQVFEQAMRQVFPERAIVELTADAPPFQVMYELGAREQIPGIRALSLQRTWEKGGVQPHWRGILDDRGRVMVAINFNQDLGDAWEHADDAPYPQRYSALAYRIGVSYVIYAMTH